jgi:hypothetical protein
VAVADRVVPTVVAVKVPVKAHLLVLYLAGIMAAAAADLELAMVAEMAEKAPCVLCGAQADLIQ